MKKQNSSVLPLVALATMLSLAAIVTVAARMPGQTAAARTVVVHRAAPVHTVRIVMHDPGCHWFQTASGLKRSLTVKGPVKLLNFDEAALKIVGGFGTVRESVGKSVRLGAGTYHITMVGQHPDDNHLLLRVT